MVGRALPAGRRDAGRADLPRVGLRLPDPDVRILSGAVWAEQSWGRYWGWDPKETSAFLTWVAYAAYLHARATRGVRGRNAAYVLLGAYAILLFTFYVVNLVVVGLHSYAQV